MRVKAPVLYEKIIELLSEFGMTAYDAACTATCLIAADMYGITTHGTVVLPSHVKRIQAGGYNLRPSFNTVKKTVSYAIIDADNSIGFASATHCMRYAIEKAKGTGIYTVFCRNANAYGAAMNYPMIAATEKMIGFTCCNSPAAMAPIGGKEKKLGTNPLSVVIPTGDDRPIIIDMATSKVAKSRFLQAKRENKPLGDGWALDKNGIPTINPDEGINGFVCPMEGFKGYGLALIIDIISGLLSGSGWQNHVNRFYNEKGDPMNVGHFFMALDPVAIVGPQYWSIIKLYIDEIRNTRRVEEHTPIALPGDDKFFSYQQVRNMGIEVSGELMDLLKIKSVL